MLCSWAVVCTADALQRAKASGNLAACGGPHMPGSRLLTPEWDAALSGWIDDEGREWALCCSTFEGCDTAAKFHAACDDRTPTLTVAHNAGNGGSNPGNFTFGGFVRSSPPACGLRS